MFTKRFVLLLSAFTFASTIVFAKTLLFMTLESPPAEYLKNGKAIGRNVEILQEACNRMNYSCRIKFVPWKRALSIVEFGKADGIIDSAYNKARAEYLFYPQEDIYVEEWYGFKRKGTDLTLDKDLANAGEISLGTSLGFEYGGIIQETIDNGCFKHIEEVSNNEMNIRKFVAKRFDMFIGVKLTVLFLAKRMDYQDKIEIVKMTGTDQDYLLSASKTYVGFSKKRIKKEIVEEFSKIFLLMKNDGTIKQIEKKYY